MRKNSMRFFFLTAIFILFASAIFAIDRLIVVAPGESFAPGSPKTGTPITQTAGVYFNVSVYTVDDSGWPYYNSGGSQQASMTASVANVNFIPQRPVINQTVSGTPNCAYFPVSAIANIATSQYVSITSQDGSGAGYITITASTSYIHILAINSFAFTTIPTQTAGSATQVNITAYDGANGTGNTVTSFSGQANLTAYYWAGGVTATTVSLGSVTFANGKYNGPLPQNLTLSTTAGQSVYITCASTTPVASSNSNLFTINPGAFSQLLIIGPGQTFSPGQGGNGRGSSSTQINQQTAGTAFYVTVYACDVYWNNVTGASAWVSMTSTDSAYNTSWISLTSGKANFSITLDTVGAGAQSITALSTGITSNSDTVPMTFSSLVSFAFQSIGNQSASQAFQVKIGAYDAYGNTVTNFSSSASLTALSGGVPMPSGQNYWSPINVTFANGLWQGNVIIRRITVTGQLQVNYNSGQVIGTSNIFQVNAGAAAKIVVSPPAAAAAGTQVQVSVYVADVNGNTVASGTGSGDSISITSSDAQATIGGLALPQIVSLSGGVGYFNIVMGTAGNQTIIGTDETTLSLGSSAPASIVVTGGAFNHVVFSNIASPQSADGQVSVNIMTEDKYGNPTPYSGLLYVSSPLTDWTNPSATTISITAGSNSTVYFIQQEYAVSFTSQNSANVNCSFHRATAQPVSIFASTNINDNQSVTNTAGSAGWSNSFTVNAGTLNKLQVLVPGMQARPGTATGYYGQPTAQSITASISTTVNIVDSWYNVSSSTDLINITSSDVSHSGSPSGFPINGALGTYYVYYNIPSTNFQIIATDISNGNISGGQTPYITIYNITSFIVTAPSADQVAGNAFWITITAYAGFPVTASTFNGTVDLSATNNYSASTFVISPTTSAQFINGVCHMLITVFKADSLATTGKQVQIEASIGNGTIFGLSNTFNVVPGPATQIMILVDGMTYEPGVSPDVGLGQTYLGYSGSPNTEMAGRAFNVWVYIVDNYYNRVTSVSNTISFNSTDLQGPAEITDLGNLPLTGIPINNGYFTDPNMVLKTVGAFGYQFITVVDSNNSIGSATTPKIFLQHNALDHFTVASPSGSILAGDSFYITVTAVDLYGNTLDSGQDALPFPSNDPVILNANTGGNTMYPLQVNLSNGSTYLQLVTMYKAGQDTIAADFGINSGTSAAIQIVANVFSRLWINCVGLLPNAGVYSSPPPSGPDDFLMFTGMPITETVNDSSHTPGGYVFDVYSVDEYGNLTNTSFDNIKLTTNDPYAIPVTITPLSGDVAAFSVIFHTAMAGVSVTATDIDNAGILGFTTPGFPTLAGNPYGLQILAPGQYVAAGSGTQGALWYNGVSGQASAEIAGLPFPVTVLACDEFGNYTSTAAHDVIQVTCTDISPAIPNSGLPLYVTLQAGSVTFTAELISALSTQIITLNDVTPGNSLTRIPPTSVSIRVIDSGSLVYLIKVDGISNTITSGAYVNVTAAPATFNVTVELVDPTTYLPAYGITDNFTLTPVLYGSNNTPGHGHLAAGLSSGSFLGGNSIWTTSAETYNIAEPIQIRVSDVSNTRAAVYSCEIVVGANPTTATFILTANPPNIQANTASVISAHLVDGNGNPIKGQIVDFQIDQGAGTLSASSAISSDIYGNYQDATVDFTGAFVNGKTTILGCFDTTAGPKCATVTVSVSLVNPIDGVVSNYPNPFRAGSEPTNISWLMTTPNDVTINIYNLFGDLVYKTSISKQQVSSLIQNEGNVVTVQWNGKNNKGQVVGNGGYICIISTIIDGLPKKMVRKIAVAK